MKKAIYTFITNACLIIAATLILGTPRAVLAQSGSLDLTFGSGGKATTQISGDDIGGDKGNSVAIQSDGKIVVAGYSGGYPYGFGLVRYNSNGTLDNTFGSGGEVTTYLGSFYDFGNSVAIQNDGKIVVAGYSEGDGPTYTDFALVRYNSDGTLDNTFGFWGIVITDFDSSENMGKSVAIQSDGKIVVAGGSALARYNSDGTLDSTFDSDGKVFITIGGNSIVIQNDGKIVVAGVSYNGYDGDFALVRYNDDGSLDNTFGSGGIVNTDFGSDNDYCYSVSMRNDGKIVVAGRIYNGSDNDFALACYNSDGTLDTTFNSDGKVTTAIGNGNDYGYSVAVQSDDKIVVAGRSYNGFNNDFALARYNSDGSLDNTFDSDGRITTDFGSFDDDGYSVAIQSDGKIVAAGLSRHGWDADCAVARYNGDNAVGFTENIAEENTISISPNPFSNELLIRGFPHNIGQSPKNGVIIISDVMGKEIIRQEFFSSDARINTEKLLPGFYLLNYIEENKTVNIKLIKF